MSQTPLNRLLFATLHQKIVETCYPDEKERKIIWDRTETSFYGLDYPPEPESVRDRMQQALGKSINGRALYKLKNQYNQQKKDILVSTKLLNLYFEFLGASYSDLVTFSNVYKANILGFPPKTIRRDTFHKNAQSGNLSSTNSFVGRLNLSHLSTNQWWFYFYEYEGSSQGKNQLMRLVMTIQQEETGEYSILLKNSGPPYTDFRGRITNAEDDIIVAELKGKRKTMSLMFSIEDTGLKDLYTGIYTKHDSNYKIRSGSVIIHRIPEEEGLTPTAQVFRQGGKGITSVPKSIADFFSTKQYTYIKTPRRFSESSIQEWLCKKKRERGEVKDIDLFISATILSMKEKKASLELIKTGIEDLVTGFLKQKGITPEKDEITRLKDKIGKIQEFESANQFPKEGVFSDYKQFDKAVQEVVTKLAEEVDEIEKERIHYSFKELQPLGFLHQEPKYVYKRDLDLLRRSKGFMVICPYNRVFSSCWVLLSWAIALGIPTFIVYMDDNNLPYILRQANFVDTVRMMKLKRPDLQAIPYWFKHSNFGPSYFR